MYDCSARMVKFHDDEVTLAGPERTDMRERRDTNRKRLRAGLTAQNKPLPIDFFSQGSYAMKTMIQHAEKKYDIDDGVYFERSSLVGSRGAELGALEARQMIRDAVDDGSFKTKPEVKPNCVRILYDAGYHVDLPIYRKISEATIFGPPRTYFELASADWKRSDARDVTAWFEAENIKRSLDHENDGQMRRICRLTKKFARSRSTWSDQIASGFAVTVLVAECYQGNATSDDQALYGTFVSIRDRLNWSLVVKHPATPHETITEGGQDATTQVLREKLSEAIEWLKPLQQSNCSASEAFQAWDRVFSTDYFTRGGPSSPDAGGGGRNVLTSGMIRSGAASGRSPVRKEGDRRYA
jgi:hypothetical protein